MLNPKKRSGILSLSFFKSNSIAIFLVTSKQKQFLYSLVWIIAVVIFSYRYIDLVVAKYCYQFKHTSVESVFHYITMAGNAVPYIFIALVGYLFYRYFRYNAKKANSFRLVFLAVVLSGVVTDILKWGLGRYRPQQYFDNNLYGFHSFQIKAACNSLPSGHTTTAFALAMILSFLFPRCQWVWWFFAIIVGLSRILLSQHYVSDVLFGAYIGVVSVMFVLEKRKSFGIVS